VALLVRTWNLFHGNTVPPGRRAYLERMVRLASADGPAVLCLQEVPVWALGKLQRWSGMTAFGAIAARPRLVSAELGRLITDLHHGLLRSAVAGQANAILVAENLDAGDERSIEISEVGERRVCHAVRIAGVGLVANLHATGGAVADEQLHRALTFVESVARPDEAVVLCGDANVVPGPGTTYDDLREAGFSPPAPGIDQIVVRGIAATAPVAWPPERRRIDGRLLSDHAPVELEIG
jgi:endonuclease/exonuclease/phosphatase family metal-dependent hydrolase